MQNVLLFVTGRKGCGKSTRTMVIARAAYENGRRVCIVDPMGCMELSGAPIIKTIAELIALNDRQSFVMRPENDQIAQETIRYCYIASNLLIVVDEADLYAPASPGEDNTLVKISRYGRHRGISSIVVSQRPANVARDLTAQADFILSFHVTEPRDVEYMKNRIGKKLAESLTRLDKFETKIYDATTGGFIDDALFKIKIRYI